MGKELATNNNDIEVHDYSVLTEQIKQLNKHDVAIKTSAGFIYQDLVFMKELLYLENDSTKLGYEVLDDIHILNKNGLALVQVKHSVNGGNLTESSNDFWKTINNWAKIVKTSNPSNLNFIFYTNRKISSSSDLYNELDKNKKDFTKIESIINKIFTDLDDKEKKKEKGQSENPIFKYVKNINELETEHIKSLFDKLKFITSDEPIIKTIKDKIVYFGIEEQEVDNIYEQLLGIITDKRYELALANSDFSIDYDYFRKNLKFDQLLKFSRIEPINFDKYYNFEDKYNEDYHNKIFYKQLRDIDVKTKDINDYARERAKASSFLDELNLLKSEENILDKKIIEEWEDIHDDLYEEEVGNESMHKLKARQCIKATKRSNIFYKNSKLPKALIIGKTINLSDQPIIGWRKDWKEKYSE